MRFSPPKWKVAVLSGLATVVLLTCGASPAPAVELKEADPALAFLPADGAMYRSMLNNREKVEIVANSKAWKNVQSMPVVQMLWGLYLVQAHSLPESPVAKFQEAMADPQVQDALKLLEKMVSDEVFVYVGADAVDLIEMVKEVQMTSNLGMLYGLVSGEVKMQDEQALNKLRARYALSAMADDADDIHVPTLLMGFRVEDETLAVRQLAKLELIAGVAAHENPEIKKAFSRKTIDGVDYLVMTFSGEQIPWDEVPLDEVKEIENEPGDVDKVVAAVKKQNLVLAVGLREGYILAMVGPSTELLEKLGTGENLLGVPAVARLAEHLDAGMPSSIGYVSKPMNRVMNDTAQDLDELGETADGFLKKLNISEDLKNRIRDDYCGLSDDLKTLMPDLGAASHIEVISGRGIESFFCVEGGGKELNGAEALSMLSHLGTDPLLGLVVRGRTTHDRQRYEGTKKWLGVAWSYFEEFAMPKIPQKERGDLEGFVGLVTPFLTRLDQATADYLIPATADGQLGIVVDAKLKTKQLCKNAPELPREMPIPEPALALGLSDVGKMDQALVSYYEIANDFLDALRKVAPGVPSHGIPEPEVRESGTTKMYVWAMPEDAGVDPQIAPCIAMNDSMIVFSMCPAQAERMLGGAELAVGGLLAATDRPLASAGFLNWAGIIDTLDPWVKAVARQEIGKHAGGDDSDPPQQMKWVMDQIDTVMVLLKTVRGVTYETAIEDGLMKTHVLVEIRDVE